MKSRFSNGKLGLDIQSMSQSSYQQVLGLDQRKNPHLAFKPPDNGGIWNPVEARFNVWFLPFIAAIPVAVAFWILLYRLMKLTLLWRPLWTKNFGKELPEHCFNNSENNGSRPSRATPALLVASLAGLGLQTSTLFHDSFQMSATSPLISWAVAAMLVAIDRPKTVRPGLLTLYFSILVSQLILMADERSLPRPKDFEALCSLFATLGAIIIIFCMSFRDPQLSSEHISPSTGPATSRLRTPEDNLSLWRFMTVSWMAPLISVGSCRQLNDEDVWSLGFEFDHKTLHTAFRELRGSVIRRLLRANGLDLAITSCLGVLELISNFSVPVLLQQLLRSMEDPNAPRYAAYTYALLSLTARLIATQSSVFSLWYCRRCYERSRGEMITMLHEKTLSRQIVGLQEAALMNDDGDTSGNVKPPDGKKNSLNNSWTWLFQTVTVPFGFKKARSAQVSKSAEEPASMGKILNLLRNDVYEIAQRFWEFQTIIRAPLGLILSLLLIWRLIGWACFIGVCTVLVAQAVNALIARELLKWERVRRLATDTKLQKTAQFIETIRHLRWYGWEMSWLSGILDARQKELNLRIVTGLWGIMISFTNTLASGLFPATAFYAYTALAGMPLRIDIAFPALQLFSMLETNLREIPGLFTVILNAFVAMGRIEAFMHEPDKAEPNVLATSPSELVIHRGSFAWLSTGKAVLHEIDLNFPIGLTIICGEVGAGKTALLLAILGELDQTAGDYLRPNSVFGYYAQMPWLQNMSIRENILFSSPYDPARYKDVLEACALTSDLASFKHGDLSDIGENGIGLSGGQKARVSLARAVYSRARILLLDDPLSALDYSTAEIVVRRCLGGQLMANRIVILVTHRTELCHGLATQLVKLSDGRAYLLDPKTSLPSRFKFQTPSKFEEEKRDARDEEQLSAAVPEKFMDDEHRAYGGVRLSVYWDYIKAGKLKWWFVLICFLTLYRLVAVGESWFLKSWSEAYNRSNDIGGNDIFDNLPSPETNVRPWLFGFFLIAIIRATLYLITQIVMLVIIICAGTQMFRDVMTRVTNATFRFYDVTPVGRLMNRLTSDISTIDGNISQQFQRVVWLAITWSSSIVVIASVAPTFLIFAFALTVAFVLIFLRFLPTSQNLRRLEMVSLSPLMSNFGILLQGLTTVRAFCAQHHFQDRVIAVTDAFQKMDHFYWSLQAWLMYRFDALSAFSTFVLTVLALSTGISPGLTAFVLIAASQLVDSTHAICKQYGQLSMDFVSVERIVELLHLEQERVGEVNPPAYWPSATGDIVFEKVTIRYAPHLDPALSNISLNIKGGSHTAIIGRTGSGKSTLALSLLATILPESGHVLIDGIDLSTVDTQALRRRVTFLAQDPVLFPGSMRQNLDPLDEHSDDACTEVLQLVAMKHQWDLNTKIDIAGRNLSQGQRQLVGLARAILRRSAVVIFDEATASIDTETSLQIQEILRKQMKNSTVIVIAHRLEALTSTDYCIVLEDGRVRSQGPTKDSIIGLAFR